MNKKRIKRRNEKLKKKHFHSKQKPAPKHVLMLPPERAPFLCKEKGTQRCLAFCANRIEENQCYLSSMKPIPEKEKRSFFKWKHYNIT